MKKTFKYTLLNMNINKDFQSVITKIKYSVLTLNKYLYIYTFTCSDWPVWWRELSCVHGDTTGAAVEPIVFEVVLISIALPGYVTVGAVVIASLEAL